MTLIVGIVGLDGIILAADNALLERTDEGRHRQSLTSKILYNPDKPWWACASAGQRASIAAQQSIRDLCDSMTADDRLMAYDFRKSLQDIGNHTWETACDTSTKEAKGNSVVDNCQVIYKDRFGEINFYRLQIARNSTVHEMRQLDIVGDHGNPAAFFAQHYRPDGKTINELRLFAGFIVLAGHWFNSPGIKGLDILMFPQRGDLEFTRENSDSLLQQNVRQIEQQIKWLLFKPPIKQ